MVDIRPKQFLRPHTSLTSLHDFKKSQVFAYLRLFCLLPESIIFAFSCRF